MSSAAKPEFRLKGVHVLVMMLAFFAAIIAVDVAFSVVAINTFPGEDVRRSYLQGLHYNDTLTERAAERALGWQATAGFVDAPEPTLVLTLKDAAGAPIDDAVFEGVLRRPLEARDDQALRFAPAGAGTYRASSSTLAPGVWDLRVEASAHGQHFAINRRLTWSPTPQH